MTDRHAPLFVCLEQFSDGLLYLIGDVDGNVWVAIPAVAERRNFKKPPGADIVSLHGIINVKCNGQRAFA